MRLSPKEVTAIVATVKSFDPNAKVFLYGSRVDDKLRGGDIDLLILSEDLGFSDKVSIVSELHKKLGEQKIDLSIKKSVDLTIDAFTKKVLSTAVEL